MINYIIFAVIMLPFVYLFLYGIAALIFAATRKPHGAELTAIFNHRVNKDGTLSRVTKLRLNTAITFYNAGGTNKLFCCGGYVNKTKTMNSLRNAEYLVEQGVSEEDIIKESYSFNTYTNCLETFGVSISHNYSSVLLISSPMHLLRIFASADPGNTKVFYGAPGIIFYIRKAGAGQFLKEILEESIKITALLLPAKIYKKWVIKELQGGNYEKLRRISKF